MRNIPDMQKPMILITEIDTPVGKMTACAIESGICLLEFSDREGLLAVNDNHLYKRQQPLSHNHSYNESSANVRINIRDMHYQAPNLHMDKVHPQAAYLANLQIQLDEYFSGARMDFSIPVVPTGTEFQQKVWRSLQTIPYGTTITYKEQAASLKMPSSIRAIANANALNNCLIIVPCHRVIGTSGSLTGYKGGLWRKRYLLQIEREQSEKEYAGKGSARANLNGQMEINI